MIKAKLSSFKCHIKAYLQSYITQFTYKNGNLQNTKYRKTEGIWKEKNTYTHTQKITSRNMMMTGLTRKTKLENPSYLGHDVLCKDCDKLAKPATIHDNMELLKRHIH